MRALIVSVDYSGELSVCLPRNRRHFDEVFIVTSTADAPNVRPIAEACGADVLVTDLFYASKARFAKALALEWALDQIGRHGLLCLMDADVILPASLGGKDGGWPVMAPGMLYGAHRRMAPWPLPVGPDPACETCGGSGVLETTDKDGTRNREFRTHAPCPAKCYAQRVPPEGEWKAFPRHPNVAETPGYLQCFSADDPRLPPPPWHDVTFAHAGSADSFFSALWPASERARFPWDVLHLGECGANWCGRVTPLSDGSVPPEAAERREAVAAIWRGRRGKSGDERFEHEKLKPE